MSTAQFPSTTLPQSNLRTECFRNTEIRRTESPADLFLYMAAQGSMAFRGTSLCKKQETNTLLLFDHWATNRILSLTDTRRAKSRRREVLSVQSHSRCMQTLSENAACIGRPEGKSPSVRSVQNPTVLWYADFSRYISSSAFLRSSDGLNSMSLTETA